MKVTSEQLSRIFLSNSVMKKLPSKLVGKSFISRYEATMSKNLLCFIRKETNHAWQVDTTKESHENKDLENNNVAYIYVEVKRFQYLI